MSGVRSRGTETFRADGVGQQMSEGRSQKREERDRLAAEAQTRDTEDRRSYIVYLDHISSCGQCSTSGVNCDEANGLKDTHLAARSRVQSEALS